MNKTLRRFSLLSTALLSAAAWSKSDWKDPSTDFTDAYFKDYTHDCSTDAKSQPSNYMPSISSSLGSDHNLTLKNPSPEMRQIIEDELKKLSHDASSDRLSSAGAAAKRLFFYPLNLAAIPLTPLVPGASAEGRQEIIDAEIMSFKGDGAGGSASGEEHKRLKRLLAGKDVVGNLNFFMAHNLLAFEVQPPDDQGKIRVYARWRDPSGLVLDRASEAPFAIFSANQIHPDFFTKGRAGESVQSKPIPDLVAELTGSPDPAASLQVRPLGDKAVAINYSAKTVNPFFDIGTGLVIGLDLGCVGGGGQQPHTPATATDSTNQDH